MPSGEMKTATKRPGSLEFVIPIMGTRRYVPSSSPPPPITLLPVHDTDAFIVSRTVIPTIILVDGKEAIQRKACYIIGWPDLPAARPLISADKILDYVSPYTLEEWEYKDAQAQREEEKRARDAAKEAATAPPAAMTFSGGKRRPGRPPKTRFVEEPPPTPPLSKEQEELLEKKKATEPSLSTPQKSRIAALLADEELFGSSDDDAALQQSAFHE